MLQPMPRSSSGACRARAVSAAKARIGVIQSTVKGAGLSVAVGECLGRKAIQGSEPDGVGLAGAGGGMQQARFAIAYRLPDLLLEREGLPGTAGKPAGSELSAPSPPRPLFLREWVVIVWLLGSALGRVVMSAERLPGALVSSQQFPQGGQGIGFLHRLVEAPAQRAWEAHGDAALVAAAGGDAFEAEFEHRVGVTLRTGPNFSTVVLRTMASTLRISSSVRPE